ncbi:hypothetical protein AACH06_03075 [Ideonella sp. DXS29W]|uniref:Photosynthesis system II assembly factor Ycf48/Hcf136-like domain-containing protein n=1 Tax=Ideonella lacteola TaxID=2984193 RepID=A0ABU9BJY6_9BURK
MKACSRRLAALASTLVVLTLPAAAAPVGEALQRPALQVRAPERSVLLSIAKAGDRWVAVGERGIVVISDDGGTHWRQAPCPVSVTLTTVRFADARRGVAVGHGGAVLTTADAGETWQLRLDGRRVAQLARAAATTPEAQKEAERLLADGPDKPFLDVLVWDAQRLLAVGAYGLAVYSPDGGATWSSWSARVPNPKGLHWYVARRQGDTLVLAGEQGQIVRSDDGGASFHAVASPYKGSWFAGELLPDGRLLMAGLRGNVWRSADASGAGWYQLISPVPATVTGMLAMPGDGWLLANQAGMLLRLQGDTLAPVPGEPLPMPAALASRPDGRLLVAGMAGVIAR